jgi:hypothetical protein
VVVGYVVADSRWSLHVLDIEQLAAGDGGPDAVHCGSWCCEGSDGGPQSDSGLGALREHLLPVLAAVHEERVECHTELGV